MSAWREGVSVELPVYYTQLLFLDVTLFQTSFYTAECYVSKSIEFTACKKIGISDNWSVILYIKMQIATRCLHNHRDFNFK